MTYVLPDEDVFQGVEAFLDNYARLAEDDTYVITYTPDCRGPAAWIVLALRQRGFKAGIVAMRPMTDPDFAERLDGVLPDPATLPGRLVVITLERAGMAHFEVFEAVLNRYGRHRTMILRVISASTEFFTKAVNVTPDDLSRFNASLLHRIQPARKIRVRTDSGTDLTIEIDSNRFKWISDRGLPHPGGFTIVPAGEIATHPARVDGVLVADGAFNVNVLTSLDARLAANPVRVEIENSMAVELTCANEPLREMLQLCLDSPHGRRVGELGLGTNRGIDGFIPANSHINERRCAVHLGFGQHNQSFERVPYVAEIHLDLITNGAFVWVDDDLEPIDLTRFVPTSEPHPLDIYEEDTTGDCCGMAYGNLKSLACSVAP
ncbi:hypothetical protein [Sphaerisporangium perillae]|uniref:hypothetical protein n=1 Tax=Sphaerisporangium perillae TaxID=2935860 RepID=UPI0020102842|nr:hypothetical protein [Sphaerisporangium perillae]